jgi:hypothetical protein
MYLRSRLDFLLGTQNADGGWGYFPGKRSWLEPTAYAMLALDGNADAQTALDRAWMALRSWQLSDGAWRGGPQVFEPHWGTALAVTLHVARRQFDEPFRAGVAWLLRTMGAEEDIWVWMARWLKMQVTEFDPSLHGWPWIPGTSSWVEPTVHAIISLKKAAPHYQARELDLRVEMAERFLLDRRCADGGWNYGNRRVYKVELPSFEETTALGLLALRGAPGIDLRPTLECARRFWNAGASPLARAWLAISLRSHGVAIEECGRSTQTVGPDVLVTALEALGCADGRYRLLSPGVTA